MLIKLLIVISVFILTLSVKPLFLKSRFFACGNSNYSSTIPDDWLNLNVKFKGERNT